MLFRTAILRAREAPNRSFCLSDERRKFESQWVPLGYSCGDPRLGIYATWHRNLRQLALMKRPPQDIGKPKRPPGQKPLGHKKGRFKVSDVTDAAARGGPRKISSHGVIVVKEHR